MAKSAHFLRKYTFPRPSRREISTCGPHRTSTSPQRSATPALKTALKRFSDIPGPLAMPMLRHSAHVLPRIGSFHHTVGLGLLEGLRDRYGDLVRLAKGYRSRPALYVFDPELMRQVYQSCATEPPIWSSSPLCRQRQQSKACPLQGEESKAVWTGIRTLLLDPDFTNNYSQAFDDIGDDITRRLGDLRHAENALNEELETELYRWALETVGVMLLGIRLGCLDGAVHIPSDENRLPLKTSIDDDTPDLCSLSKRNLEDLTPAEQLVRCCRSIADGSYLVRSESTLKSDSLTFKNALQAFDKHFSLTDHFLQEALRSLEKNDRKSEQVLLESLRPLDQRILPLAADILLAGVDPLAQTALSMFYHLSLHPATQQRAHDEVAWSAAVMESGSQRPELAFIGGIVKEALRLHPATGGVVRRSTESFAVAGYEIPAGVDIILAHGVTGKSEQQWGRAKTFIPERWSPEGWGPLQASRAHPSSSMPFGETCPATGVVGKMLGSLSAKVLDKYRLEWHGVPPNMASGGVNRIQPPFYFVLQNAA